MTASTETYDVAIAGAGPAGASVAIHLAMSGARVLLVEQKRFPREKLCGEFITPECLKHFDRLGVHDKIVSSHGAWLSETVFYSPNGFSVTVPSEWFGGSTGALGLSRARMDHILLIRAREVGVFVLENTHVGDLLIDARGVRGIRLKIGNELKEYRAVVTIDATGRPRALARRLDSEQEARGAGSKPKFVAFKAHLSNTRVTPGACEIYFYPRGYGGLSDIEGGVSNFCFIVLAKDVRRCGSDPGKVISEIVSRNSRAAYTLADARAHTDWLSVPLEHFGRRTLVPAEGLLTVGDAAAFIDPFTGSGMLMAFETGEIAAQAILNCLSELRANTSFDDLAREYQSQYRKKFDSRLRICNLLRRAAFTPGLAEAAILCFGASARVRRRVARATRRTESCGESPGAATK
jgi:flavin-dependent dehydrogenase